MRCWVDLEMNKNVIFLISLLIISKTLAENPWESSFPGGYLSIGLQMGKTKDKTQFMDIQISPSIVLIGPYKHDLPGYLFLGTSIGKRYSKGNSFGYFDINLNFWNVLFTLGTGRGVLFDKNKRYLRNKYWGGLGFIPVIFCTDNYYINENKYKQIGIMGTLPLPVFGNNFYP
tara:strand:- start:1513 stop:2031 length:519 start_codon:yes stop_codon:yes gene_type:complete